jgi:hypothetical protein
MFADRHGDIQQAAIKSMPHGIDVPHLVGG